MPRNIDNKKCLLASTLEKYIGQIKEEFRRRFPEHPDFSSLSNPEKDDPVWFARMMVQFVNKCDRNHIQFKGNDDIEFGDTKTQPLYRDNC